MVCEIPTPFGIDVVPDVKIKCAIGFSFKEFLFISECDFISENFKI